MTSKILTINKDFYLTIISCLEQGWTLSDISKSFKISKQRINYYVRLLKANGNIKKVGYGVWKVLKKEVKNELGVGKTGYNAFTSKSDVVRGHGFMIKLILPFLKNWHKRNEYLKSNDIQFEQKIGFQSITFKGVKVWLCEHSIIFYLPNSYYSKTAEGSYTLMVTDFYSLVASLEALLNVSFRVKGNYSFKVKRNHYSLINNALARQYNYENKKLEIKNENGIWLLIDNSFNLNELETIHPKTARPDNEIIQSYFNDLKQDNHYLPSEQREIQELLAKNVVSHLSLIKEVKELIKTFRSVTKK